MRVVRVLCLVLLAAAAPHPAGAEVTPQKRWSQVVTPHFRVAGDASDRLLRQAAERMEQLHALVGMMAPDPALRAPETTVIVFRDRRAYAPFTPLYEGKPQEVGGYFISGPMNYITVLAGAEDSARSVVFHEYVHLVMNRTAARMPTWVGEGLAEFYSTFDVTDGGRTAHVGGMLQDHLWRLQKQLLPLATLVAVDHDSPYYNERDKSSVFYAQSWALVHYLQLGADRKYAPRFGAFLEALAGGTPFAAACATQLGVTPEALEKELAAYVFSPVLYRGMIRLPERIEDLERQRPSVVPEAEVHALLGDLLRRLDGRPAAREHLDFALSLDGTQALALGSLAQVEAEASADERVRELAARAAGQPTYLTEYYRADALEQVAPDMDTDAVAIEAALRKSVELNPAFAPALTALARRLGSRVAGRDEALALVTRAIPLAPTRDDYVLIEARIHLQKGDTKTARQRLGPLMARGSTPEVKAAARELMGYVAKAEAAVASGQADTAPIPEAPRSTDAARPPAPGPPPPEFTLDLRPVADGETRVAGIIALIECGSDGLVVTVTQASGSLRLRAKTMAAVQFVSYRDDLRGAVSCGPQGTMPVLATYRAEPDATSAGVLVALEYVPAGYTPPPQ
jgi:tetratricopeptide (TPR) repeat protein